VFINIFGGITRGEEVARGVLGALEQLGDFPQKLIVRLDGTNAEEGRRILEEAAHPSVIPSPTMQEAAALAVAAAKERSMSIFIDESTKVVVQGIGAQGTFHAARNKAYGTQVVAGVHPKRGGETWTEVDAPIFSSVAEAVAATGREHLHGDGPGTVHEGRDPRGACGRHRDDRRDHRGRPGPRHDRRLRHGRARRRCAAHRSELPGTHQPGKANVGIIPADITMPGRVGLVSRSGTLTYQIMHELAQAGIGISTCVGIGGDPVIGTQFLDVIQAFAADPDTDAIAFVGEIGGGEEQRAGEWIRDNIPDMPVVGYIAGFEAPGRQADGARRRDREGGRPGRGVGGGEAGDPRGLRHPGREQPVRCGARS
jgi:succinyl-CoA synthetase alpha subunit